MARERMTPARCTERETGASFQRPMGSDSVVVTGVRFQNATQMRLAQDNNVVHTLAPDRSDQPLGETILPGRGGRNRLVPDAHGAQSSRDHRTPRSIPVAERVTRSFIPRE